MFNFLKDIVSDTKHMIVLSGREIEYQLRTATRTRNIRLTIYPGRGLVVSVPSQMAIATVEKFLAQKTDWITKHLDKLPQSPTGNYLRTTRGDYLKYKTKALELSTRKVVQWNSVYGFAYKNISVRNQKTRWGSCSSRGNLSFNYRIVDLPEHLVDYLVIHELCHLKEMNHSQKFWNLVAIACPDYRQSRRELKLWGIV
jgi:predicted metal-dependent hydrolase